MVSQNDEIQNNVSKFATINEVRGRIDVMSDDLNSKLSERPTMKTFKSALG